MENVKQRLMQEVKKLERRCDELYARLHGTQNRDIHKQDADGLLGQYEQARDKLTAKRNELIQHGHDGS